MDIRKTRIIKMKSVSGYTFQYKKESKNKRIINSFLNWLFGSDDSWYWTIPVYETEVEAEKALEADIQRIKQFNPEIQIVKEN